MRNKKRYIYSKVKKNWDTGEVTPNWYEEGYESSWVTQCKEKSLLEVKAVDLHEEGEVIYDNPAFYLLNGVNVGPNFFNRVGRKIRMKDLWLGFEYNGVNRDYPEEYETRDFDLIRISVIYDRFINGVVPSYSDIFNGYDLSGGQVFGYQEQQNILYSERFIILYDKQYIASPFTQQYFPYVPDPIYSYGMFWNDAKIYDFETKVHIDLDGLETTFKGASGIVTDVNAGALILIMGGKYQEESAAWKIGFNSRVTYVDA